MDAEATIARAAGHIRTICRMADVYFRLYPQVDQQPEDNGAEGAPKRKAPRPRRIRRSVAAYAISAAIVEIPGFESKTFYASELNDRVEDVIFRGQYGDLKAALAALERIGWATLRGDPRKVKERLQCSFTPAFVALLRTYTTEICGVLFGDPRLEVLEERWKEAATLIFEYFQLRYLPEWLLLLRRLVRAAPVSEGQKLELYDELVEDPGIWREIHWYLVWHGESASARASRSSLDFLQREARFTERDAEAAIAKLIDVRICRHQSGKLIIESTASDAVAEFCENLISDHARLVQALRSEVPGLTG